MTRLRAMWLALLLSLRVSVAAEDVRLCLSDDGLFRETGNCSRRDLSDRKIEPSAVARKFVLIHKGGHSVWIGVILPGSSDRGTDQTSGVFALHDEISGAEGASGEVVLTEAKLGVWRFPLEAWWFQKGRLNLHMPKGTWNIVITAGGKPLLPKPVNITFNHDRGGGVPSRPGLPPGRITVAGRALGKEGTPDFARITADCRTPVCDATVNGSFRCDIARPRSNTICVEHPRLGRRRVELDPGRTSHALGDVELLTGATIRVMRPLHVEFPEGTKVSLRHRKIETAEPQAIDVKESIEFAGLEPGKYELLLAGPEPLQRKLFPVTITGGGEIEMYLSVDAWRLTGDVSWRDKPLANASVTMTGEAWEAELTTDQSGRFDAELWSPGDYAVLIGAASLAQPYGEMKRASASDHHWRLDIPSRRITGRVTDAATGRPAADATLLIESTTGETRWSRAVPAGEDGTFEIPGIGVGEYAITPRAPGFLPGDRVTLQIGKTDGDRTLSFALERGAHVPVLVVDTNGEPVADALVAGDFTSDGRRVKRLLRTNADGRVIVPLPEKTVKTIYILPRDGSIAVATVAAGTGDPTRVVVPDAVSTLALQTRTNGGEPLPLVPFELRWEGHALPPVVLQVLATVRPFPLATDERGRATLDKLPAGRYEILWRPAATAGVRRTAVMAAGGETVVSETF